MKLGQRQGQRQKAKPSHFSHSLIPAPVAQHTHPLGPSVTVPLPMIYLLSAIEPTWYSSNRMWLNCWRHAANAVASDCNSATHSPVRSSKSTVFILRNILRKRQNRSWAKTVHGPQLCMGDVKIPNAGNVIHCCSCMITGSLVLGLKDPNDQCWLTCEERLQGSNLTPCRGFPCGFTTHATHQQSRKPGSQCPKAMLRQPFVVCGGEA